MSDQIRKEELDVSKIFLAYLFAHGDAIRAAQVAQCTPEQVLFLARTELWDAKLSQQSVLKGTTPEEARQKTRELNRATNYIQALRLRELVDRTIRWCYEEEKNILNFCIEIDKQGKKVFSTKPMLELVKAAEVCQTLLYRALGDTVPKEAVPAAGDGFKNLHALIIATSEHLAGTEGPKLEAAHPPVESGEKKVEFLDLNAEEVLQ